MDVARVITPCVLTKLDMKTGKPVLIVPRSKINKYCILSAVADVQVVFLFIIFRLVM